MLLLVLALPGASAGTLLVANKAEGSVTLLHTPRFATFATLPAGEGPHEIAVAPDGLQALVTNYGTREKPGSTLTLLNLDRLRPGSQPDASRVAPVTTIELPEDSRPHGVVWVSPEKALVTAEGLDELLEVDVPRRRVSRRIAIDQEVAHMVAAARDGSAAWVASIGSGSVSEVDLMAEGSEVTHVDSGAGAEGIALVNGGRELWVSNRDAGTVVVFSVSPLRRLAEIAVGGFPIRVTADDERGRVYVTLARDDAMVVIDRAERKLLRRIDFDIPPARPDDTLLSEAGISGSIPVGLLLSRDGKLLFVAHTNAHRVSVRDAGTLERLSVFSTGREPDGMAWTWVDLPFKK